MGFRTGAYATVWEIRQGNGNYAEARLSISKKNKETDSYETDFSGYVRLVGEAYQKAGNITERDRIRIDACDVTTYYKKDKNVTYTNFVIFDFERVGGSSESFTSGNDYETSYGYNEITDDDLPF